MTNFNDLFLALKLVCATDIYLLDSSEIDLYISGIQDIYYERIMLIEKLDPRDDGRPPTKHKSESS